MSATEKINSDGKAELVNLQWNASLTFELNNVCYKFESKNTAIKTGELKIMLIMLELQNRKSCVYVTCTCVHAG